ncbi:hypothetical protein DPMN_031891 [Dreissena polymorpha]|uniref:Uncharacterized protein n=2 Tax=Dreissena polymorpha TaxID=45954 RepID=A0A9D4RHQ9_DREPO|nr:hypothetical protein DPMN_031891 [Dreissena polymorpha]
MTSRISPMTYTTNGGYMFVPPTGNSSLFRVVGEPPGAELAFPPAMMQFANTFSRFPLFPSTNPYFTGSIHSAFTNTAYGSFSRMTPFNGVTSHLYEKLSQKHEFEDSPTEGSDDDDGRPKDLRVMTSRGKDVDITLTAATASMMRTVIARSRVQASPFVTKALTSLQTITTKRTK